MKCPEVFIVADMRTNLKIKARCSGSERRTGAPRLNKFTLFMPEAPGTAHNNSLLPHHWYAPATINHYFC